MSKRAWIWGRASRLSLLPLVVLCFGALSLLTGCQPIQPVDEGGAPAPALLEAAQTPAALDEPPAEPAEAAEEQVAAVGEAAADNAPATIDADALSLAVRMDAARRLLPQVETLAGELQLALPPAGSALDQVANNPFLQILPQTRQAPAPDWLRPGLRVTYYTQNAIFADSAEDPAPSGAGFLQYDLVSLDENAAVTSLKYFLAGDNGEFSPGFVAPSYGLPGVGDYWIAPQALVQAEDAANPDLFVGRMPTEAAGQQFNAVRFQTSVHGGEYVWMFDEASGLLLFHRYRIVDGFGETSQAGQIMLAGMRSIELPWVAAVVPQWVQPGVAMRYDGAYTVAVGGSLTPMPYAVDIAIQEVHPGWAAYTTTDSLYGRTNTSAPRINGVAQLYDALWLPRSGLVNLEPGQLLDADPFTGVSVQVTEVNRRYVTLEESGALHTSRAVYDRRSGQLVALHSQRQAGLAVIAIDLELANVTAP